MGNLIIDKNYKSKLGLIETEVAIKYVKDNFERELANSLNLTRVSAPLFVLPQTGLNDNLNGYERAVSFDILDLNKNAEIVQSLAKWKRYALNRYGFENGYGLYTDMNAIRRDEELDNIHSIYVDQWDYEKVILDKDRNIEFLKETVKTIYNVFKKVEKLVNEKFSVLSDKLPQDIYFISSSELLKKYPNMNQKERENIVAKEHRAVFIYQIGWPLEDGLSHDGRAADYDDWNLNGDIIFYNDVLKQAFEVSSMGIRVNSESLLKQLEYKNELSKLDNPYCKAIIDDKLPKTLGGGIGQSRICMFFLEKLHIAQVQSSLWSEDDILQLKKINVEVL